MPAKRLSMRKLKEILRLKIEHDLSNRAVARSCSISHLTVEEYLKRFIKSGLSWPLPEDLDDNDVQRILFPPKQSKSSSDKIHMPDMWIYWIYR